MKLRVASGAASALLLTFVTLLVSIALMKLVVGALPSDRAGFWFLLLSFSQFILFFDLGFSPTLARTIALTLGRETDVSLRSQGIGSAISTLQRFTYAVAAVIFIVGVPLGIYALPVWLDLPSFDTATWIVFLFGAITNLAGGVSLAALNGLGYVATERGLRSLGQIVWLITTFFALRLGYDLLGLAAAWALQGLLVRASAGILLRQKHPELYQEQHRPSMAILKEMLPSSVRWAITSLGAFLILQTGNIVVAKVLGTTSVPAYEAINRMLAALMTLGILVASASSPYLSRAYGAGDTAALKNLLFMNLRIGLAIILGAAIFLAIHGREIVSVWLSPEQFAGESVLYFGIAMAVLEVHHVILATAVMASGPVPFAGWAVGAGVLNLILGFLLVPRFGLVGMAAATFLSQLFTNNWYAPFFAFRRFKISIAEYLRRALGRSLLAAGILSGIGFALNEWTEVGLFLQALIYLCCVGVTFLMILFEKEEKAAALVFVRKKFGYA